MENVDLFVNKDEVAYKSNMNIMEELRLSASNLLLETTVISTSPSVAIEVDIKDTILDYGIDNNGMEKISEIDSISSAQSKFTYGHSSIDSAATIDIQSFAQNNYNNKFEQNFDNRFKTNESNSSTNRLGAITTKSLGRSISNDESVAFGVQKRATNDEKQHMENLCDMQDETKNESVSIQTYIVTPKKV